MAGMEVVVQKDTVSAALAKLAATARNPQQVTEAIGLAVVSLAARSFNEEEVRAAPWAPLKPETVARKIQEGTSTAILKRHVLLARSFRVLGGDAGSVRVGTDRGYAGYHQWGAPRAGIPPRPMLPLTGGPGMAPARSSQGGSRGAAQFTQVALRDMMDAARAALRAELRR